MTAGELSSPTALSELHCYSHWGPNLRVGKPEEPEQRARLAGKVLAAQAQGTEFKSPAPMSEHVLDCTCHFTAGAAGWNTGGDKDALTSQVSYKGDHVSKKTEARHGAHPGTWDVQVGLCMSKEEGEGRLDVHSGFHRHIGWMQGLFLQTEGPMT